MPRIFKNEKGDWGRLEKLVREILVDANDLEKEIISLVKNYNALKEKMFKAYHLSPMTDALFYDSPAAPRRMLLHFQAFLKKVGFDGVTNITEDPTKTLRFQDHIKDSCLWLLKLKDLKENEEKKE